MFELFVLFTIVKWQNRNSVINIECKAQSTIVNYDHVFYSSISDDSKILDKAVLCIYTVLTIEPARKEFVKWIDEIKNQIRINLVTGCKCNNLERLLQLL